jgi:hypothetical protein
MKDQVKQKDSCLIDLRFKIICHQKNEKVESSVAMTS